MSVKDVNKYPQWVPIRANLGTVQKQEVTILHISDTHGVNYSSSVSDIPVDICVHSGDFFRKGSSVMEGVNDIKLFFSMLSCAHKILVCGNHEIGLDRISPVEVQGMLGNDIILLQDTAVEVLGIKFYGSPWNNSKKAYSASAAARAEKWSAIPNDTDVLITHIPPHGILDLAWDPSAPPSSGPCPVCGSADHHPQFAHWGDAALGAAVEWRGIPLHLFGHVHDQVGVIRRGGTVYSNAAMDIERTPCILKLLVSLPASPQLEETATSHITAPPVDTVTDTGSTVENICWPTEKLSTRLALLNNSSSSSSSSSSDKPRVVLLTTGALNPVHVGHLRNMERAKQAFERLGCAVLAGYLCPSGDRYVGSKMENKKPPGMPLHKVFAPASVRVQLTSLACAGSDWLSSSSFEADRAARFIDFPEVQGELESFLLGSGYLRRNGRDKVVYVCGQDHYEHCGLASGVRLAGDSQPRCVAVVPRSGCDSGWLVSTSPHVTVVSEEECDFGGGSGSGSGSGGGDGVGGVVEDQEEVGRHKGRTRSVGQSSDSAGVAAISSTAIRDILHGSDGGGGSAGLSSLAQMLPLAVYTELVVGSDPQYCNLYR
jgi:Icc-related predicted phosphoesterase